MVESETDIKEQREEIVAVAEEQNHEGEQLKKYMEDQHLSIAEMAQILGVKYQTVYLQFKRKYFSTRFKRKLSEIGLHSFKEKAVYTPKEEILVMAGSSPAAEAPVHEGEQLRKYMTDNRLTHEEMANILNVSRQGVYLQTKRTYLSPRFRKSLSELGDYRFQSSAFPIAPIRESAISPAERELFIQEIKRLQNIVALQAEHIRIMGKLVRS